MTAEAAKSLAKGEMDARIAAEKEATAAKETLAASEIRYKAKLEAAEARADKVRIEQRATDRIHRRALHCTAVRSNTCGHVGRLLLVGRGAVGQG